MLLRHNIIFDGITSAEVKDRIWPPGKFALIYRQREILDNNIIRCLLCLSDWWSDALLWLIKCVAMRWCRQSFVVLLWRELCNMKGSLSVWVAAECICSAAVCIASGALLQSMLVRERLISSLWCGFVEQKNYQFAIQTIYLPAVTSNRLPFKIIAMWAVLTYYKLGCAWR